jgi:CHAD domain-containing protein/inorganic triphosphatase YgiF
VEIEAKFAVPDVETFRRLRAADQLAGLALSAAQIRQVSDTYLDTPDRRVLAAGYACRRREEPEGIIMTLKGLRGLEGAVHRREELEVRLPADQPPAEWPASPVRDLALQLIGDAPLIPLFNLHQTRILRMMSQGEQTVAQLSLDEVRLSVAGRDQAYFELEAELTPPGNEDDLAAIVAHLQDEWGLKPEPRSKFERALAFLEESPPGRRLLTPQERDAYQRIAERGDAYSRRARALLALDAGATQTDAGGYAGLSARQVRHWLSAFRKQRPDIFPGRLLDEAQAVPSPVSSETPETPASLALPGLAPQPLTLEALFERYQVDQAHARTVADHALALFDHLHPFHGLPSEQRSLLETAALLHNVGMVADPDRHHIVGRDILLAHPLAGLDDAQRLMLALITFLHRKRITRQKLSKLAQPPFDALPEPAMQQALAMAALVRMADGLDYSQTESSRLELVWQREGLVEIEVTGPQAAVDADRAQTKSDLWRLLFDVDLRFKPVQMAVVEAMAGHPELLERPDEETLSPAPAELPAQPGLGADDPIAEAARKILGFHFQRMVYHEPGTRLGEDIEALHDMRVATRRMRAAFRLFGDYLDMEELAPIAKGLRRTGRILGAVRDLDVFWAKTQRYLESLPLGQPVDLDPLHAAWEAQRARGREEMLAYLESNRYARFKERFDEFLHTPGAGALPITAQAGEPAAYRLRQVVPAALYQRLAAMQAFDEWVSEPDVPLSRYHQLRIISKGMRYALEFFQEVLGPEAGTLIGEVKALQDHLGDLQDAVVASNLLRDFLMWGTWGHGEGQKKVAWPTETVVAPGVAAYLAARQAELQHLVRTFPQVWTRFPTPGFSRLLASALEPLWL